MSILTDKYNIVLAREKKAEKWMKTATGEQVDKWLPEYNKIVKELGGLMIDIEKELGRDMTTDETLNGF